MSKRLSFVPPGAMADDAITSFNNAIGAMTAKSPTPYIDEPRWASTREVKFLSLGLNTATYGDVADEPNSSRGSVEFDQVQAVVLSPSKCGSNGGRVRMEVDYCTNPLSMFHDKSLDPHESVLDYIEIGESIERHEIDFYKANNNREAVFKPYSNYPPCHSIFALLRNTLKQDLTVGMTASKKKGLAATAWAIGMLASFGPAVRGQRKQLGERIEEIIATFGPELEWVNHRPLKDLFLALTYLNGWGAFYTNASESFTSVYVQYYYFHFVLGQLYADSTDPRYNNGVGCFLARQRVLELSNRCFEEGRCSWPLMTTDDLAKAKQAEEERDRVRPDETLLTVTGIQRKRKYARTV